MRWPSNIDVYGIFALAGLGIVLILISLAGNVVGSLTAGGEIGTVTGENYLRILGDDALPAVLARTIVLGIGSVGVLMLFALPFAWLIARTDFPWKNSLFTLLTAKLAIPGFVTAMAYVWLFNPTAGLINKMLGTTGIAGVAAFNVYGLSWMCFLHGLVLTPAAVFMMLPAFRNMDTSLEEAAWVSGVSRGRTIRRIVAPLLAPGIFAAALFFFVVAVEIFDIVGLIGIPGQIDVLVIWIYDSLHPVSGLPNFGFAGAIGFLLFAICGLAIALYVRMLRRGSQFAVVSGKGRQFQPIRLGNWRWAAAAFVGLWVILAVGLPIVTLIWVALVPYFQPFSIAALSNTTMASFQDGIDYMMGPLRNTGVLVVGTIAMCVSISLCVSWAVTRSRSRSVQWMDGLVFLAPAVPAMVTAVAFQFVGIAIYDWLPIYGTMTLIVIAMSTRMLAFCTRTMNAASLQIHFDLEEVARASGVSRFMTFRRIFLPIMTPAIFYSALMVGMLAARDLTMPLVMNTGQTPTIATLVFDLQTNGDQNAAAAIAIYMIVFLALIAATVHRVTGMSEPGFYRRRAGLKRLRSTLRISAAAAPGQ